MQTGHRKSRTIFHWILSITFAFIFILTGFSSGSGVATLPEDPPFEVVELPPEAKQVSVDVRPAIDKSSGIALDSALTKVAESVELSIAEGLAQAGVMNLRLKGERIQVQIAIDPQEVDQVITSIELQGGEITTVSQAEDRLQGWLPISSLKEVSEISGVYVISRPAYAHPADVLAAGSSMTEGAAVLNALPWHAAGITGQGVKVGIIDGGFTGFNSLLGTDLPASVTSKNFVDGETDPMVDGTTIHGTACAEIVHDTAPGAELYLAKVNTNLDLQEAVLWLKDTHHVDIISTSLGWYNLTPGDGTGEFADLVALARGDGIFWATAAGNDRESHWGGAFNNSGFDTHLYDAGEGQDINYFGPGNGDAYVIPSGVTFGVFLRWDDWTAVDQDYDMELYRHTGSEWTYITGSFNFQDGSPGQFPTEAIVYTTVDPDSLYGIVIWLWDSTRNVNLELFSPDVPFDERVHERSLANLADAPDAITVAALDVTSPYPQEPYSSEGPTNGTGGTAGGGFLKPDIAAFANVSTESYGPTGFNGTSAATPHVAGAAALVKSAYPSFTPSQLQTYLEANAVDMGPGGMDTLFGYGRLMLPPPPYLLYLPLIMR
jgi:subtilisin family serine protease